MASRADAVFVDDPPPSELGVIVVIPEAQIECCECEKCGISTLNAHVGDFLFAKEFITIQPSKLCKQLNIHHRMNANAMQKS